MVDVLEALVVARYQGIVTAALTAAPGLASAFAGVDL
jgi:phage tail protein X